MIYFLTDKELANLFKIKKFDLLQCYQSECYIYF